MAEGILYAKRGVLGRLPLSEFDKEIAAGREFILRHTQFMTDVHWAVRAYAVCELARRGSRPLPAEDIAHALSLSLEQLNGILKQLESNLFFLVRNESGAVSWAYPATSDVTPHHVRFSSGEQGFAA